MRGAWLREALQPPDLQTGDASVESAGTGFAKGFSARQAVHAHLDRERPMMLQPVVRTHASTTARPRRTAYYGRCLSNQNSGGVVASTKRIGQNFKARRTAAASTPAAWARAAAALSVVVAPSVFAQTPSPLGEWQYSAGIPLEKMYQPKVPDWEVRVGTGLTFMPRYDGSSRYHTLAGPSVDLRYRDVAFASTGEGIGVNVIQGPNWRASISAVYDLGRRGQRRPGAPERSRQHQPRARDEAGG